MDYKLFIVLLILIQTHSICSNRLHPYKHFVNDMYTKESVDGQDNILANIDKDNLSNNTDVGVNKLVSIMVFYESFCPGSREFITTILKDTYEKLSKYIYLYLLPYGNAKTEISNGNYVFTCQHGPKECYGNMLHACVIDNLIHNNSELMESFIVCLMDKQRSDRGSDDEAADQCGKILNLDPLPIKMCAKGVVGQCLHNAYGYKTSFWNITYVPFVLINGTPLDPVQYPKLMHLVCKKIVPQPPQCKPSIF